MLGSHPDVFLTEPKELFFFSRLKETSSSRFESAELDWYLAHFRDPWPRWIAKQVRTLARTGRAYRPKVRGEATASYAAMDRDLIEEIAVLRSDVKILLTVRHPVERAWSHAKKDLARNRGRAVEDVSETEWLAFFRDPYQMRCAGYARSLANWRAVFSEERVFVGTFEEVEREPDRLLSRVTAFLGIDGDPALVDPGLLRRVVNPTTTSGPPPRLRDALESLLAREIAEWSRLVGSAGGAG